ncbi:MAG: AzlC family ABC transporter permease [Parasporobacterium sp.]|nr:AzlC family ABC transporter permease [Parasporobacterium sp.]
MFKKVLIKTLPVMAGYIVLGAGFGLLLKANGYGILWALAMSIFIYAGSMQFVGVSLLAGGASFITVALTTLMVNARHLFYGITMIDKYKGTGLKKPYLIHALTDETYSLLCTGDVPEGVNPHKFYFWVSLVNQSYWVIGSVLGSLIGSLVNFNTAGIEFSMTALFVTVFTEQWLSSKEHRPALTGLGITVVCLFIFGKDSFLIPALIIIMAVMLIIRKPIERKEKELKEKDGDGHNE